MDISITRNQNTFINAQVDEVLFGGAAGGGKSYGQLIDALLYALKYNKSKQLILRRTFPELEKSLIRVSLELYPRDIAVYNDSKHIWRFKNGSIIDFAYCDNEKDVYKYQSAEYDVIRFDELTHFTETMYIYLLSRIRGANPYPKMAKSSTNPGGVGHIWVKERFIDIGEANKVHEIKLENGKTSKRIFIPSKVQDNKFLLEYDPDYLNRLENLPEKEKKALLYGDWDIFDGVFFPEFKRDIHVISPFLIPDSWNRYIALDYGLDMFAVVCVAINTRGKAFVYKEIHESDLIISKAAKLLKEKVDLSEIKQIYAPPDLWNRRNDTGKSAAEIFFENRVKLNKCSADRVNGWLAVKEWIMPFDSIDEQTEEKIIDSNLKVFANCVNLIRCLPAVQHDENKPNDVATEPHELTHITDALRYFCVSKTKPTKETILEENKDPFFSIEKPRIYTDRGKKIRVV